MRLVFSEPVLRILEDSGYAPDRSHDFSGWVDGLSKDGFELFPIAEVILSKLGGIEVKYDEQKYTDLGANIVRLEFDPAGAALGEFSNEEIDVLQKAIGGKIFPIAEFFASALMVSEDGRIWLVFNNLSFVNLGESIADALVNVLFHADRLVDELGQYRKVVKVL